MRWQLLFLLGLSGCAGTTRITADYDEYQKYRRTRVAETLEDRLAASHAYLKEYKQGEWRKEVRRWFLPAERRYFKLAWNSLPRLVAYARAMPDGPHAQEVLDRIVELESARGFVTKRDERELEHARSAVRRLETAADSRHRFMREFKSWVSTLAAFRNFGAYTSDLDDKLIYDFRLSEPNARCTSERCIKALSFRYEIPDQKELSEREALFDVVFTLDRGRIVAMSIIGPDLFSRLGEARELRAVRPGDEQGRAEAIARALQVVESAVQTHLPVATCEREAVAPVVLSRACSGVSLVVTAATEPGADDRIEITKTP
jgi:hypothetical protein